MDRMNEIVELLNKWSYEYYVLDNPTISDQVWDNWFQELLEIEKTHPELKQKDSPSLKIGGEIIKEFKIAQKYIDGKRNKINVGA